MRRRSKDRRLARRVTSAWVALSTLGMGLLVVASGASAATQYDVVNMTANAASIHVIGNSNAFPNFRTGAIDNSYAYAHSHVDGSPFSQGRASPLDTGPLVQLQAAENGLTQPQYTDVRFPPANSKPQEFGSQGSQYAESFARENYAFAQASEIGQTGEKPQTSESPNPTTPLPAPTSSTPGIPASTSQLNLLPIAFVTPTNPLSGTFSALNAALIAWRARWLTADDALRYPARLADASEPDGQDGMSSVTEANFDEKTGSLIVRGDSRVARVSLGGGAIQLNGVRTKVMLTDNGTEPESVVSIDVAGASVGGVPVTIGANGVSVAGTAVPGVADGIQQASAQLNTALVQSGWSITAVKPDVKSSPGQKTVDASAVHVKFLQPTLAPGVPTIYFEMWVGQVFADQLGTVSTAIAGGGGGGGGSNVSGGGTQFVPGSPGSPGSPGAPGTSGTGGGGNGLTKLLRTKPVYLILLYAMWQVLMIGTVASLWWMRMGGQPA